MNLKPLLTALLALLAPFCNQLSAAEKANIIVVLADDLGIGDPTGKKQANELYNLQDDPAQKTDLAGKNPKLVAELRALLEKERTRSKE